MKIVETQNTFQIFIDTVFNTEDKELVRLNQRNLAKLNSLAEKIEKQRLETRVMEEKKMFFVQETVLTSQQMIGEKQSNISAHQSTTHLERIEAPNEVLVMFPPPMLASERLNWKTSRQACM